MSHHTFLFPIKTDLTVDDWQTSLLSSLDRIECTTFRLAVIISYLIIGRGQHIVASLKETAINISFIQYYNRVGLAQDTVVTFLDMQCKLLALPPIRHNGYQPYIEIFLLY